MDNEDIIRFNVSEAMDSMDSTTTDTITPSPPEYISLTYTFLYCAIFLVGVVGNLTVILVITCSRRLKTAVNMYLVNLCVADLLVLLLCMPTALSDIFTKEAWYFGSFMCKS